MFLKVHFHLQTSPQALELFESSGERAEEATPGLKFSLVQVSMNVLRWVLLMTLERKRREQYLKGVVHF